MATELRSVRNAPQSQETIDALVATVRQFVQRELEPIANEVEESGSIPAAAIERMAALGLFGLLVPEEFGGLGLGMHAYCRVAMELAKTQQAFRSRVNINNGIGVRGLVVYGTPEQKAAFLPALAAGKRIASFALTEPHAGSDVSRLETKAERVADGYTLTGTKQFVTNGPISDTILVLASTDPSSGRRGVSAFLVDTLAGDPPGLTRGKAFHKMGFRGSLTSQLFFDGCFVPDALVVGAIGEGFAVAMSSLNDGRLAVAAGAVGASEHLLRLSIDYARQRVQFGKPIAEHQAIQHMLADMATEVELARTLLLSTASERDEGLRIAKRAAMVKLYASEMACRVADNAMQIFGGYGYMHDLPIERFYRDLRLFRIVEGTSEIQRTLIARQLLRDA